MAHFAKLDSNNIVTEVIVVANDVLLDDDGVEQEALGIAFCEDLFGGTWKQTSYNGNIRKNFAGKGFKYVADRDAFVPPKPYPSWVFNSVTYRWNPPVAYPNTSGYYEWDEETQSWVSANLE